MRSSLFYATAGFSVALAAAGPTVQVLNGTLHGAKCPSTSANYFLSIPYAKPPVRFTAPEPLDTPLSNNFDATQPAPSCIQLGTQLVESGSQSEDWSVNFPPSQRDRQHTDPERSLFLDVWVPSNATASSGLPVKVWVYGGSDETGGISDPLYNGCFSATDAVIVAINYRLGPLGWLSLQRLGLSGNFGLQDQLLGLQWVQDNIAAFGGDPVGSAAELASCHHRRDCALTAQQKKVLLFGQSAGAFDVFALASLPQAPSLMKAAAMQSGGGVDFATLDEAEKFNEQFVKNINCSETDVSPRSDGWDPPLFFPFFFSPP